MTVQVEIQWSNQKYNEKQLLGLLSKCYSLSEKSIFVGLPAKAQPAGTVG